MRVLLRRGAASNGEHHTERSTSAPAHTALESHHGQKDSFIDGKGLQADGRLLAGPVWPCESSGPAIAGGSPPGAYTYRVTRKAAFRLLREAVDNTLPRSPAAG